MPTALQELIAKRKAEKEAAEKEELPAVTTTEIATATTTPPETKLPFELQEKLASLSASLEASLPIREVLRDIHTNLKQDPDNATLLSEDEVAIIVAGLKKQTNTEITTSAIKGSKNTKKLKSLTVADL